MAGWKSPLLQARWLPLAGQENPPAACCAEGSVGSGPLFQQNPEAREVKHTAALPPVKGARPPGADAQSWGSACPLEGTLHPPGSGARAPAPGGLHGGSAAGGAGRPRAKTKDPTCSASGG